MKHKDNTDGGTSYQIEEDNDNIDMNNVNQDNWGDNWIGAYIYKAKYK